MIQFLNMGKTYNSFLAKLKEVQDSYIYKDIENSDLSILSYMEHQEDDDDGYMYFHELNGSNDSKTVLQSGVVRFKKDMFSKELVSIAFKEKFLIYNKVQRKIIWVDREAIKSLTQFLKYKGEFLFEPGFIRNLTFARGIEKEQEISVILRKCEKEYLLCGVTGKYYIPEEKDLIPNLVKEFEKRYGKVCQCIWKISDKKIRVFFTFENLNIKGAEIGISIQTSYDMTSSFYCSYSIYEEGSEIPIYKICRKHSSTIDAEEVYDALLEGEELIQVTEKKLEQEKIPDVLEIAKEIKRLNYIGKRNLSLIFPDSKTFQNRKSYLTKAIKRSDYVRFQSDVEDKLMDIMGAVLMAK